MILIALVAATAVLAFWAARRSLTLGLSWVLAVGYAYGILRANYSGIAVYLLFDAAVVGLYAAQFLRVGQSRSRVDPTLLWFWCALTAWPVALFFFSQTDLLVELAGLRGNVFLLPFLVLGARLSDRDLPQIARTVAWLNLAACFVAGMEFFVGIEAFFPDSQVTWHIYRSKDLLDHTMYRIPSTFVNAHAYGGTMVMTVPLLLGALFGLNRGRFDRNLFTVALAAALIGIFLSGVRVHVIVLGVILTVAAFSIKLDSRHWLRWAMVLCITAGVVANQARLQRFTTLADSAFVAKRVHLSMNEGFWDLLVDYPMGRGLAGGGTSLPEVLKTRVNSLDAPVGMVMENEYARILLEQGIPGLLIWIVFIIWVLARRPTNRADPWHLGRRLGWTAVAMLFAIGLTGIGLLTAIPHSCLWLLTIGWAAGGRREMARSSALQREPLRVAVEPARGVG